MPDLLAVLAHVDDRKAAEGAEIVRLSTTRCIERGAVKRHCIVATIDDRCFERREIRVVQEEQFGQ
jgi:hypothetical protein